MNKSEAQTLFERASNYDSSLNPTKGALSKLSRKHVAPTRYSREALFRNMADGKVSIFQDYPSPLASAKLRRNKNKGEIVLESYQNSGLRRKIRIRTGRKKTEKYVTAKELVEKWRRKRMIMNVTDFHFRETQIEETVDPNRINHFNLYPGCDFLVSSLEMMTLVMSSIGGFSDSHSDDSDGSNHCFVGQKLWLAWDTHEGLTNGLEDVDRVPVYENAKFSLDTWVSLKSSRWFTVESGQTLFLPGHLTHKVITLEPYLGVGSFYVAVPNWLRTISRWLLHTPNWQENEYDGVEHDFFPIAFDHFSETIKKLNRSRESAQQSWGMDFLDYSIQSWKRQFNKDERKRIIDSEIFQIPEATQLRQLMT